MKHKTFLQDEGFGPARELSFRADQSITGLFNSSPLRTLGHWCIVAVGGYGRQELCPYSDVDILFLKERKAPRDAVEKALRELLYPLWDLGLNASYSVRTARQAIEDAKGDFFFRNSLLDARFVCGSKTLFDDFAASVSKNRYLNDSSRYIADLVLHTAKRHEKYGDAVYFLEPHIKDGHGGLRDYQSIMWVLKVLNADAGEVSPINRHDLEELRSAGSFLLKTRFALHTITARKTDQMFLEHQEALASELGYGSGDGGSPVEAFLKDYHTNAMTIRTVIDPLLEFLDRPRGLRSLLTQKTREGSFTLSSGLLDFTEAGDLEKDPLLVMKAFALMGDKGLRLSPVARSRIKDFMRKSGSLEKDKGAQPLLLKILRSPHAENVLTSMLETGALEALIPEFRTIRGKTIFDVYHTFTVDLHSIHTVSELGKLEDSEPDAFGRVRDKDALFFSAFLHDIGKGRGSPHAQYGAEMIRPIADRFGFDEAQTELIVFLLSSHLVMADIATKRDLSEEKVIHDLAQKVGSAPRLSMLYLLTVADSRATGPSAWNEWKAALLRELYARTLHILEKGIMKSRKNATRLEVNWHQLVRQTETEDGAFISGRLWALPQEYVLRSDLEDVRTHLSLSSRLTGPDDLRVEISHRRSHTRITVIAKDRPGLFALLTGVLAINRMDIISADIFTWYDGTVVDTFKVNPPWPDYEGWDAIEKQFREFNAGGADLASRIGKTRTLKSMTPSPLQPTGAVTVGIDNGSSDFFTVIDVKAPRNIGLLYDISTGLSASSLDIHRAFLSRSSDLAVCVFYVAGPGGEKVTDPDMQREVREKISDSVLARAIPSSPGDKKKIYSSSKGNDQEDRTGE